MMTWAAIDFKAWAFTISGILLICYPVVLVVWIVLVGSASSKKARKQHALAAAKRASAEKHPSPKKVVSFSEESLKSGDLNMQEFLWNSDSSLSSASMLMNYGFVSMAWAFVEGMGLNADLCIGRWKVPDSRSQSGSPRRDEACRQSGDCSLLKRLDTNGKTPIATEQLLGVTIEQIKSVILGEECMHRYYRDLNKVFDFNAEAWFMSRDAPGTYFRKAMFKVPIDVVPNALKALMSVPKYSVVNAIWQLTVDAEGIMLMAQNKSQGAPFSENFVMQDTVTIRAVNSGIPALELSKWFTTEWIVPLPWTHGIVKATVESQGMESATAGLSVLARICESTGRC